MWIQGSVSPAARDVARRRADELRISMARYLEELVLLDGERAYVQPHVEELPMTG